MTITSKSIYSLPIANQYIKILAPANGCIKNKKKAGINRDKIVIVLPTYNERKNIVRLIPQLEDILEKQDVDGHVIIVDDNSTDGTGTEAIRLARSYGNITVIQRPGKMGLGSAYRVGFKRAIEMGMDIVFMMDSDLSHRPSYIPKFLACMKKTNASVVIGSRYCKGGGTDGWPTTRKMISFGANFIARVILGITHVHDTTSGFRAFKVDALKAIDYDSIYSDGYSFLGEMLFRVYQNRMKIKEIPFIFYERKYGTSKLGKNEIKGFILYATRSIFIRIAKALHLL
ncbi:MAG: polyprenol monophosphomannose synthase [Candidatus Sigynarchaeota archaeon]